MLKNIIAKAICSLGIFGMVGVSTAFAQNIGQVNANNVNVRAGALSDSEIVSTFNNGQAVNVSGVNENFYEVSTETLSNVYIPIQYVNLFAADGIVTAENVNIRRTPFEDGQILGQLTVGDAVVVNAKAGDWYVITYQNDQAYIHKDFVGGNFLDRLSDIGLPKQLYAIVKSDDGLNLRSGQSVTSTPVCALPSNSIVDVVDHNTAQSEWVKVAYENTVGYANAQFLEIKDGEKPTPVASRGNQIVSDAKQFLGTPYVWGGTNLNTGVDCSGFVQSVMKNSGISLPHSSARQAGNGTAISKAQLQPGDLVFFSNGGGKDVQHVGIFIGNGQFIHACSGKNTMRVTINSLSEAYYLQNYVTARRVIG